MIRSRRLRREQQKDEIDLLAVERIEIDRLGEASKETDDVLQIAKAAVRYRSTLAQASRAQALTLQERIEESALLDLRKRRGPRRQLV